MSSVTLLSDLFKIDVGEKRILSLKSKQCFFPYVLFLYMYTCIVSIHMCLYSCSIRSLLLLLLFSLFSKKRALERDTKASIFP